MVDKLKKQNKSSNLKKNKTKIYFKVTDANEAVANIAYAYSEVAAIYPITPASPIGEYVDKWSSDNKKNIFDSNVDVVEMESEAGASGAVHGSLSSGVLTTTFTASQGLLLMIPNMNKIAGELLPTVFHVASRSIAAQSLSIFGDHSDVMSTRQTGFAILSSSSVQEAQDMAVISHLTSLESRIPFLHFFDGFRTSHEINKIIDIDYDALGNMFNQKALIDFRKLALNPNKPLLKVGAQNPDVYFQGRETVNHFYDDLVPIIKNNFKNFKSKTKRAYDLFEYYGSEDATDVIVIMGSGSDTVKKTVEFLLNNKDYSKVGLLKVRLYRPFSVNDFLSKLPLSVKRIAVMDRTKEPGSIGEPLYLDVVSAMNQARNLNYNFDLNKIKIVGGRYGLSSKEFNPGMVKGIFDYLKSKNSTHNFTVGIIDDVTQLSIDYDELDIESGIIKIKLWGYGSDGTVGSAKNTLKIIGNNTDYNVQGYFSYDSRKSGGTTQSYLRISKKEINLPYIPNSFDIIALHKFNFIEKYDVLENINENGVFIINSEFSGDELISNLTKEIQSLILSKNLDVYYIDANKIAMNNGLGNKINIIMQTVLFKILSNLKNIDLNEKESLKLIQDYVIKTFGNKGKQIVNNNLNVITETLKVINHFDKKELKEKITNAQNKKLFIAKFDLKQSYEYKKLLKSKTKNPEFLTFIDNVIIPSMHLKGDLIPVSKMPVDGAIPTGTTKLEKRKVSKYVVKWDATKCIQCGLCSMACPHSAIRTKQFDKNILKSNLPDTFNTIKANWPIKDKSKDLQFRVQNYPMDCTGCSLCIDACPTKALSLEKVEVLLENGELENEQFFEDIKVDSDSIQVDTIKGSQLKEPLFEFSGACAGCGETPYIRLLTQLYGDNLVIANATGCSSIYGGTFPFVPYTVNKDGKGPAWANSLFEDNAEYGLGMRIAVDKQRKELRRHIQDLLNLDTKKELNKYDKLYDLLSKRLKNWSKKDDVSKNDSEKIKQILVKHAKDFKSLFKAQISLITQLKDYLVDFSIWAVGGDGWAYDIGFNGLDHALASSKNLKVLVLDTEVYSNTGGQASKSTPFGASAKFAVSGKRTPKKNLAKMLMSYGYIYVASVNIDDNPNQVITALKEAEDYDGPAIVIAYSHCIAHGVKTSLMKEVGKRADLSGYWPLFRFNPSLALKLENPFVWDGLNKPTIEFSEYIKDQNRYMTLDIQYPKIAKKLHKESKDYALKRFDEMKDLSLKK